MATTQGKGKNKKTKGTKLSLQEFNADDRNAPQGFNVVSTRKVDWAQSMENEEIDDTFTLNYKKDATKVLLPTAPKSTRGPDIDMSRVPSEPPFKAYLGNLPYDISEDDISAFFSRLKLKEVRLIRENGRQRGFGYAEFYDRQSLIEALTINGDMFRNRSLKVGLPGDSSENSRETREEKQDRTAGNWRSEPRDDETHAPRNGPRDGVYQPRNGTLDQTSNDVGTKSRSNFENYERSDFGHSRSRGGFENDRGFERQPDRGFDRPISSRSFNRPFDRNMDRPNDRGFERNNDRGFDRQSNRYGGRPNRGNEPFENYDRTDSVNEREPRRGYEKQEAGYDQRSYGRRFEETDSKYSSDRHTDRSFNERRRDFSGPQRRREEPYSPSPPLPETREEIPKERPKLNLKPRSKPLEETDSSSASSAIFGGAKPVNTAVREKEIEERLLKEKEEVEKKVRESAPASTLGSTDRIRRISASSNVSGGGTGTTRSRKGSDSGPINRDDFGRSDYDRDDNYRNPPRTFNSSMSRQRKYSDRSDRSDRNQDSGPKQILRRKDPPQFSSSQGPRYQSLNQRQRPGGNSRGGNGGVTGSGSFNRRKDRDRERDRDRRDNFKPARPYLPKSDEEDLEKRAAYTSANKFAHLNDDIEDNDYGGASE